VLDTNIARALRRAHLFVALLSPEYLASHYCWRIEYQRAMNRRARGTMRVAAVVVRPCDWKATRAAGFKLLPKDGRAVTRWRSADDAFLNVVEGIRGVVKAIRKDMMEAPANPRGTRAVKAAAAADATNRAIQSKNKAEEVPARSRQKSGQGNRALAKKPPRRTKGSR